MYLLLYRSLEIDHATSLQLLGEKLEDVAVATTSSNQVTAETLQRLEAQLAVDREAMSDIPSMRSLASSVSDIVSMLSSRPQPPASIQSSAHCSSAGSRRPPLNPGFRRYSAASIGSNASSVGSRGHSQSRFVQTASKAAGPRFLDSKMHVLLGKVQSRPAHLNED